MSRHRVGQEAFEYADDRTLTVVDRAAGRPSLASAGLFKAIQLSI